MSVTHMLCINQVCHGVSRCVLSLLISYFIGNISAKNTKIHSCVSKL